MPARYVRAYLKGNKNDFRDAEAIAEAVQRPTMRFVATKTAEQLDLQALHRVRSRLISERTAVANEIRAFLLDRGIAVAQGLNRLRAALPGILATRTDVLSPRLLHIIEDLIADWRRLDQRIDDVSEEIEALAKADAGCERLMTVPGIGPIISSGTVAAIGTGDVFGKGRDFSAWLGLVRIASSRMLPEKSCHEWGGAGESDRWRRWRGTSAWARGARWCRRWWIATDRRGSVRRVEFSTS